CLRDQICSHEGGVGVIICNYKQFAGAGGHVNCNTLKLNKLLGPGYIPVSRAEYFINSVHRLRTEGHGGYGLRASDRIDCSHTTQACSIKYQRTDPSVSPGRRAEDDVAASGQACGYCKHQDG